MGKDIEKLFRDQLTERAFGWKEDYWHGAEAFIIEAQRRRRHRFLLLFGIGGLAVLGCALALLLRPGDISDRPRPAPPVTEEQTVAGTPSKDPGRKAEIPPAEGRRDYLISAAPAETTVQTQVTVQTLALPEQQSASFSPLPSRDFSIFWEPQPFLASPASRVAVVRPSARSLAWRAGVGAGANLYPGPGVWAGGIFQGNISGKLGFAAGLQYQILQIPPFELGRTGQRKMQFGEEYVQYVSEAGAVHQLQVPIGVTYRLARKWQMEAGGLVRWRIATRGTIKELSYPKPWERTTAEQAVYSAQLGSFYQGGLPEFPLQERSSVTSRGWVDAGHEGALQVHPYAGVQFLASNRFSITGRIAYRAGKPWPPEGEGVDAAPWSVSAGAYYWIR